jgi:hypothetical protein
MTNPLKVFGAYWRKKERDEIQALITSEICLEKCQHAVCRELTALSRKLGKREKNDKAR